MLTAACLAWIAVSGLGRPALLLPLSLSIAIVYKTARCESVREIPLAALALWVTIVVGMYAVGVGIWLVFGILVGW